MSNIDKRLPAEWEAQSSILLTWPHNNTDWKSQLSSVEYVYYNIAKIILTEQNLIISCEDSIQLEAVTKTLASFAQLNNTQLKTFIVPADDTWARDHGPIGIIENNEITLLDFNFNAWGGKYEANKDNNITKNLFDLGTFPSFNYKKIDFILEGGSIESDGSGTLMTTEKCLLNSSRNGNLNKQEIESQIKETLGIKRILWLKHGFLAGDDTDAHIDTLARFCDRQTICYVACNDQDDEHFAELKAMKQELETFKTTTGEPYKLIPLPMTSAIYDTDTNGNKIRLPATYANFLITNQSILLPIYHVSEDRQAIEQIQYCFPGRKIIPIDCRPLIKQHGSLHCATMQITQGLA